MKTKLTPIAIAVMPLKADAMTKAEQYAQSVVARVTTELAAVGGDIGKAAPTMRSFNASRVAYLASQRRYALFHTLCRVRAHTVGTPAIADVDPECVTRFIQQHREIAAAQYDAFVTKLEAKIGPTLKAKLEGNHVWGYSLLRVQTQAGELQTWKTQQITNVSKLGNYFPQWPSRQVRSRLTNTLYFWQPWRLALS